MKKVDLIIIGAGPAGLSAGIYALERKLKTMIFEANSVGGQLNSLYPCKFIYDYPGFESIKGKDLTQKIYEQVLKLGGNIREDSSIIDIQTKTAHFEVTENRENYLTTAVLLATGMGDFTPKHLKIENEDKFTGKEIFYRCLPEKVTRKRIVIVGGGDTALENAVIAAEKGAFVTLIHRSNKFRALEQTVNKAKSLDIKIYLTSQIVKINGTGNLQSVEIENNKEERKTISTDYLIICIGSQLSNCLISKIGIKIANQAVWVDNNMQTSIPGIFACGDIVIPAGKYKRITLATGTAATAINGVYQFIKHPYWGKKPILSD